MNKWRGCVGVKNQPIVKPVLYQSVPKDHPLSRRYTIVSCTIPRVVPVINLPKLMRGVFSALHAFVLRMAVATFCAHYDWESKLITKPVHWEQVVSQDFVSHFNAYRVVG